MKHDGVQDDGMDDRALRDAARRLGVSAAERVDVERMADAVVRRLREAPPTRSGAWVRMRWLRIAAMLAVLIGGGLALRQLVSDDPQRAAYGDYFVADDLSDLSADELRELLAVVEDTAGLSGVVPAEGPAEAIDLTELDAQQLRDVLRELEG